jgi:polyferredoxin
MSLPAELVLIFLAAAMAAITAVLVKWAALARAPLRASVVQFLLLMMAAMLGGVLVYYASPGLSGVVAGLYVASAVMSVSVVLVFLGFLREVRARNDPDYAKSLRFTGPGYVGSVVGLVLLNEFLMGWAFSLLSGTLSFGFGPGGANTFPMLAAVVVSPWFVFTMSAEMAMTAYFLRDRLSAPVRVVLLGQAALMFLSPPVLGGASWADGSILVGSAAMIGLIVYIMEYLYRHPSFSLAFARYLVRLLAIYALMMAGILLWQVYGTVELFALSVVLEMVLFFDAVILLERFERPETIAWQARPFWAFEVLATVFVAELFMGGMLAAQFEPSIYLSMFPTLTLSGPAPIVLADAISNGFYFFANTVATTGFLGMMGLEMGLLVVFRLREAKSRELKVRLAMMMGCYAAFAVFYPSLYYGELFPQGPGAADPTTVPVLGWSMGIGSAPLAVGVFGVLVLTYVIFGVLCLLFGRRVICSVFCTAPLMYQGTTIDAMKTFNRSSPVARKYLSSRFSTAYSVTTAAVLVALAGTSVLSYLDTQGMLNVTVGGADPSVFFFTLSFSVMWYVLFVTIPYAGNYNCVTMGWCYTGQIAAAFSRAGFFRLKVKDKDVCRRCTTLDCAKACPVGLTDMPGHFRQKGEFRSAKCCGVGDCADVCPYGNLYLADVRHWFRRARRPSPLPLANRLPMAGAAASTVGPSPGGSSTAPTPPP